MRQRNSHFYLHRETFQAIDGTVTAVERGYVLQERSARSARKRLQENSYFGFHLLTGRLSVYDGPFPHEELPVYRIESLGPDGATWIPASEKAKKENFLNGKLVCC